MSIPPSLNPDALLDLASDPRLISLLLHRSTLAVEAGNSESFPAIHAALRRAIDTLSRRHVDPTTGQDVEVVEERMLQSIHALERRMIADAHRGV